MEDEYPGEIINGIHSNRIGQVLNSNLVGTPCNHGDDSQTERNPIIVLTEHREGNNIIICGHLQLLEKRTQFFSAFVIIDIIDRK